MGDLKEKGDGSVIYSVGWGRGGEGKVPVGEVGAFAQLSEVSLEGNIFITEVITTVCSIVR